jgi:hypothetical protein
MMRYCLEYGLFLWGFKVICNLCDAVLLYDEGRRVSSFFAFVIALPLLYGILAALGWIG